MSRVRAFIVDDVCYFEDNDTVYDIHLALPTQARQVEALITEAAQWLVGQGIPLWTPAELDPVHIEAEVKAGYFVLAWDASVAVGVMRFTLEDTLFWPEAEQGEACYVHRLAVRRAYAGKGVPASLLSWAGNRAARLGRPWLRLDCEAKRPKLRALYEGLGFGFHSEHTIGDLCVARYQRTAGE